MKLKSNLLTIFILICSIVNAQQITMRQIGSLPNIDNKSNCGVAGAFVGQLGDKTVIAGGSNFPIEAVWNGGQKYFADDIYILSGDQIQIAETKLPKSLAHGCSASLNNKIYCFGGENQQIQNNRVVYSIEETGNKIVVDSICLAPENFIATSATVHQQEIYVIGVEEGENRLYKFNPTQRKWSKLAPSPSEVRTSGVSFVRQHDGKEVKLYLIGGRATKDNTSTLCSQIWVYSPSDDVWDLKGDMLLDGKPRIVMASGAIAYGAEHILIFGGDNGVEFMHREQLQRTISQTTDPSTLDSLKNNLRQLFINHKGFSNEILAYHTITNTTISLGSTEFNIPVVTSALQAGNEILIPSGEINPGVRTPHIYSIKIEDQTHFGLLNYIVLFAYLAGMIGIGVYFSRKESSTEQFFKGGSNIPWWAAGISIFATALSAITFLSIPAKAYANDWAMFMFNMTILLIVPFVIKFYLPFFRRLNVASAYQFLEQRFSGHIRRLAALFFSLFMFARIAIVLFLPSLALNAITGMDIYLCIVLMGVVTTIYCTMGGIEAVIWGDVIQGFVLVGGALISLAYMIGSIDGGLSTVIDVAVEESKFNILNFAIDFTQPVIWVAILGGFANQLLTYTSDQSVIQRYITVKDDKGTRKGLWLNGWLSIPIAVIFFMLGTALYVFFKEHPDMLNVGMSNTDSIFPRFIMCRLPMGIAGLVIAAVFAAAMSTLSSNINSTSTVLTEDFYKFFRKNASEKTIMRFAKISGVVIGGLGVLMAIMLATWDIASLWDQFNFFLGLLTSGMGGLFMMGIFTKRIGSLSAMTGFVVNIVVLFIINRYSDVSFLLYGFIGLTTSFSVGYLSSFVFGRQR